jgi:hypothetical protein
MKDGIPQTSKLEEEGFHGFGMKSMAMIAEKYGGGLNVATDDDLFTLNVYFMRPYGFAGEATQGKKRCNGKKRCKGKVRIMMVHGAGVSSARPCTGLKKSGRAGHGIKDYERSGQHA